MLAQAYGLGQREVLADAVLIVQWTGPADELLAALRERHAWSTLTTYRYLRTLRRALAHQQVD